MAVLKPGLLGRTYRHVQRYRHIIGVLFKYGFGDLIDGLKIEQYLELGLQMISRHRREKIESLTRAERVRMALGELGPTFIKTGQILSTRPDLLPMDFIVELEKLQSEVPPFGFVEARGIIESELKVSLETAFDTFQEEPLAAASIGQVHCARLRTGEAVVVKVQRPETRETVEVDLEIMHHLAGLMERYLEGWDVHRPTKVIDELAHTFERELDYTIEASHQERFARQFRGEKTIHVPKVYRNYTTTRVLTMEYIDGIRSADICRLRKEGYDTREIARRGANLVMCQIFTHGFFHADPHPGNLLVLPGNVVCYLDFGMMGRVDRQGREEIADLVMAVALCDEARVTDAILKITLADGETDRRELERNVAEFMDQHLYRPLKEVELGKLLHQMMQTTTRHRLGLPPDIFLIIKALSTAESLCRNLDPEFDIVAQAAPFVRRVHAQRYYPRRMAEDLFTSTTELLGLFRIIPGELREILRQAKQGKVKIEFEHRGLEPMLATYDRVSNRLSFSIVLASLVIGSSLMVLAKVPPTWNEIPIIGLAGFLFAGVMGFWLLVSILRRGSM